MVCSAAVLAKRGIKEKEVYFNTTDTDVFSYQNLSVIYV